MIFKAQSLNECLDTLKINMYVESLSLETDISSHSSGHGFDSPCDDQYHRNSFS